MLHFNLVIAGSRGEVCYRFYTVKNVLKRTQFMLYILAGVFISFAVYCNWHQACYCVHEVKLNCANIAHKTIGPIQ